MLLLQVRAKVVPSPWAAKVFEISGPFSHSFASSTSWPNWWQNKHSTLVNSLVNGLHVETSRPYLNVQSDWNAWLYFVVLAWWFNVIILSAVSSAQQLQHFSTMTMKENCLTCGWRGTLFSGQIWTLNSGFDPKISLWHKNKEACSGPVDQDNSW